MKRASFALLLCGLLTACPSPVLPGDDGGVDVDAGADAGFDAGLPDAGVVAPDTAVGRQLTWLLSMLNGGLSGTPTSTVSGHFTASFLTAVPVGTIRLVLGQYAALGPYQLVGFEGPVTANALTAIVVDANGEYTRLRLTTSPSESDTISGLLFQPAADLDPTLDSWAKVEAALTAAAPMVNYLEADIGSGSCVPVHSITPQTSLALGSAFKLYVLATLADEIDAGTHTWTEQVAIRDEWKSLPSGQMQNDAVGTLHSLQTYAEQMISISDNTAADHLLWTVGRPQVEAMVGASGHHDPTLDQPFLTTRELFFLKLLLTPTEQQSYVNAAVADKRTLLAGYDSTLDPRTFSGAWGPPRLIEQLEWFASAEDLCKVMVLLKGYGGMSATAPVMSVLSINPGVFDGPGLFSYVGFKGGSEPGVLTLTWLLQRSSDQGWRVVTVAFNDPTAALDESRVIYLATAARALAGR